MRAALRVTHVQNAHATQQSKTQCNEKASLRLPMMQTVRWARKPLLTVRGMSAWRTLFGRQRPRLRAVREISFIATTSSSTLQVVGDTLKNFLEFVCIHSDTCGPS